MTRSKIYHFIDPIIFAYILLAATTPVYAETDNTVGWVIVDTRSGNDDVYLISLHSMLNGIFAGSSKNGSLIKKSCQKIINDNKEITDLFGNEDDNKVTGLDKKEKDIVNLIRDLKEKKDCSSTRWISNPKDRIAIIVIYSKSADLDEHNTPNLIFQELKRDSAFIADLRSVFAIQSKIVLKPQQYVPITPPTLMYYKKYYNLKYEKGVVNIDIQLKGDRDISAKITTGTTDSWFISLDVPIASLNDLQNFNSLNNYYFGVDYLFKGDAIAGSVPGVFDGPDGDWGISKLYLKGMVMNSDKPLNSIGVGLGYKDIGLDSIPWIGDWLNQVSPFVAGIYSQDESNSGSDKPKYSTSLRFGLSLNVNWKY